MTTFDIEAVRASFPSLALKHAGRPVAYFDGPGGTQVPGPVIDAVLGYYTTSNANDGGAFATSERSDATVAAARAAVADLYGAKDPSEIKFGYNMTTLTFHASRSLTATMSAGDEIVVTTLDHEANVSPWQTAAADRGLVVRTVDIRVDDGTLDFEDFERKLSSRTRLVAIGYASNALGTINPVAELVRRAHEIGAWTYVDAVALAPHHELDVRSLGTDFLVTSAYKWFGPHLGALYGRAEVLDSLPAYKVRPAHDRYETGTQSFEAIAGTGAAVEYLAALGRRSLATLDPAGAGAAVRRQALVAAMSAIRAYELGLLERLISGLRGLPGVRIWGTTDTRRFAAEKAPTVAITFDRMTPREAARALGDAGLFTWDGDFYAQALIERLGLASTGGVLRIGIVHYNTRAEVDRLLEAIEQLARYGTVSLA